MSTVVAGTGDVGTGAVAAGTVAPGTPAPWAAVLVDAVFVVVLTAFGLLGFQNAYGGAGYLAIGLGGVVLGVVTVELCVRWRRSVLVEAGVAVVAFFLVGGVVAARSSPFGGVVPTPQSLHALLYAGVFGWKELLTTAPPVGNSADLLAIPYLVGLVGGLAGQSLARRTRSAALPLLAPAAVLAVGILFGSRVPTSLLLQGAVFGGLALAWVGVRYHRYHPVVDGRAGGRGRLAVAAVVVVAVAAAGGLLGPELPGARNHTRVVLSRYVVPPFDVDDQPSPLGGFRQYATDGSDNKTVLFTVEGLRPGSAMRIATMDEYDGVVWGFGAGGTGPAAPAAGDTFQKFGSTIPTGQPGPEGAVVVTMEGLGGVWIPDIGETTRIAFTGPHVAELQSDYRYDADTGTAAQPVGLRPGDRYVLDEVVPPYPSARQLAAAGPGQDVLALSGIPTILRSDADQWAGHATGAWAKVSAIAGHFKQVGKFSDGNETPTLSLPGHDAGRLVTFLEGGGLVGTQIVGDDEQYAATMALMADAVGVPARVVLGADVGPGGVVRGGDVHAWIEVSLAGLGWVPMYQSAFLPSQSPIKNPPTQVPQQTAAAPVQPPVVSAERSPLEDQLPGTTEGSTSERHPPAPGPLVPGWVLDVVESVAPPIAAVALVAGTIGGIKRRRRRRRRRATRPSTQIAGAWAELVDVERDLGGEVPRRSTRGEQATHLGAPDARGLAGLADAAVFGPGDPTPNEVEAYWTSVDRSVAARRRGFTRWHRWRATLSLRSLRFTDGRTGLRP